MVRPKYRSTNTKPWRLDAVVYDEVFVISQFWAQGHFHRSIENIPRVGVFVCVCICVCGYARACVCVYTYVCAYMLVIIKHNNCMRLNNTFE